MKMLARNPYTPTNCKLAYAGTGEPVLKQKELDALSKLPDGSRVGVQFMGDLFHARVLFCNSDTVINYCNEYGHLFFFILTKRSARMLTFAERYPFEIKKHVWLGVSVETQECAEVRIRHLVNAPCYSRWISVEPMLDEIDISRIPGIGHIGWVVCGMETGPEARPMKIEWVANLLEQCRKLGIPFFFKNANADMYVPDGLKIQEYPEAVK
jgi:protein gp37